MKQVRTAKGAVIDMAALAKENETTRAVGNVPMNGRGDRLDTEGNVVATVQRIARVQHDNSTAPVKKPMSKATSTSKKEKVEVDPKVLSEIEKTRPDGSRYIEIEYEDGSIETKDIKE